METVREFMDGRGVSILFVHHNRKMKDDDDPFNMISGTNGIMGASDTTWVLMKDKRSDGEVILYITGRDVEQSNTVTRFNKDTWRWEAVGEVAQLAEERTRAAYDQSPVVTTIKKLLEQSHSHRWSGTAKELMEAGKYITKTYLAPNSQKLGYLIRDLEKPLFAYDGIIYSAKSNGTGGKKHDFYYQNLDQFEEVPELKWTDI